MKTLRCGFASRRVGGLAAVLALFCSACAQGPAEKPAFPAQGKVLYKGKPISPATVAFHAKDPSQKGSWTGKVREDGSYKISAPAGEYSVTVVWTPAVPTGNGEYEAGPNKLPRKYEKPESSGLSARIGEGPNLIPTFDLDD